MTTPQDFDRLSAYLDNQLSLAEKAKLEARLEREPELKVTLEDLRITVRALRSLPAVNPPRNFTLTPAQAQAIAPARRVVFPALRLATALAALAFVVVVAGDFATNLTRPAAAPAPASVAEKSAVVTETPVAPMIALGAQSTAAPAATEAPAENVGTTSAADTTTETGTPAGAALLAPAPTPLAESGGGAAPPQTPPTAAPAATLEVNAGARASAALTETPTAAGLEITPTYAVTSTTVEGQNTASNPSSLRYLEAGLALLTLLLALAAWVLRAR